MAYNFRVVVVLLAAGTSLAAAWTPPVNLGPKVNSNHIDVAPSLGEYGGTTYIFFTSGRAGGLGRDDIWYATGTPPNFGEAVNMGAPVNSSAFDGGPATCWTGGPTANTLYFCSDRPGGFGGGDIYQTTYSDGSWSAPVGVGENINTYANEWCPQVARWQGETRLYFMRGNYLYYSPYQGSSWGPAVYVNFVWSGLSRPFLYGEGEGAKLYYSSRRGGGYGDYDIWVSTYAGGNWGEPANLGPEVNTHYAEFWQRFAPDGKTMYFCSNRLGGQGGYDIWYTVMDNPGVEPASVGRVKALFR